MINIDEVKIDSYMDEIVKSISEIVQIKSVKGEAEPGMPFGEGPTAALKKGLQEAEKLGFRTKNLDNKVGYAEIGEGEEIVGILGHLDVVPEGDLEKWSLDPYSGAVKDGYIWGRGVSDNKGPVMTCLYAVKALADTGIKLNKRIRIIMGADEESGFGCMKRYLETEENVTVGFTPDATFPGIHGEKGILQVHVMKKGMEEKGDVILVLLKGGNAVNSVPDSCQAIVEAVQGDIETLKKCAENYLLGEKIEGKIEGDGKKLKITLQGKAAHGAEPHKGINSISHMMKLLHKIGVKSQLVDFCNSYIGLEIDGTSLGIKAEDSYGELTLNLGMAEYSEGDGILKLDIRYPITADGEAVIEKIQRNAEKEGLTADAKTHKKSIYFDLETPFIKALGEAYTAVTGDNVSKPITIGGGTYARAMGNIIAFGGCFMDQPEFAHQPNERAKIENIHKQGDIYIRAIYNLLKL